MAEPVAVVTNLAQALETVIEGQALRAFHNTESYANIRVECDHGRLKCRLRPMRGLKTYSQLLRVAALFDELLDLI